MRTLDPHVGGHLRAGAAGAYQWRIRVLRTGREIIEIERRARASAEKRGNAEELSEVEARVVAQEVSAEGSETEDS